MSTVIKVVPPKPQWEWPKEDNSNCFVAEHHDPWETLYVVIINEHGFEPETQIIFHNFEDAERYLQNNPYGGKIIETTYGEMYNVRF